MKKSLLLLFVCAVISAAVSAQSLSLSWTGGAIANGDLITVTGDTTGTVYSYVLCTNNNASALGVKVKKKHVSIISGSENTFCWGICYLPTTWISSQIVTIQPDSTSDDFTGEYSAKGNIGTSIVMYTFFDESNPNDSICVQVAYDCGLGISVPENQKAEIQFSGAYPNPANHQTSFSYFIPESAKAQLLVRDMLGNIVNRTYITEESGILQLDTDKLSDGVYFYSLMLNDQPYFTRKLVVKH